MDDDLDELMGLDDAAPLLGLKNGNAVGVYVRRGVLEARKIGHKLLITRRQINAYLDKKLGPGLRYSSTPRTDRTAAHKPRTTKDYIDPQAIILP